MIKILSVVKQHRKANFRALTRIAILSASLWMLWVALPVPQELESAELEQTSSVQGQGGANVLLNPSFEERFYWEFPNHYVAEDWNRWWIHGSNLPEYTDSSAHSIRPHYDGERAQVWHIWGRTYTAGIYQVAHDVNPCRLYKLSAWNQNHSLSDASFHARAGLDPKGTQLTPGPWSGAVERLPPQTVWSPEQTALYTWENISVTAEALNDKLTAIFYTSPERGSSNSTYFFDSIWDAASLVPVTFPDGRLPAPGGSRDPDFIYNVTATARLNSLVVEWDTKAPASTQVLYEIRTPTGPITPTLPYSHTVYVPIVSKALTDYSTYDMHTALNPEPVLHHRAVIGNLEDESTITIAYVPLSRYLRGSSCATESFAPETITIQTPKVYQTYLPLVAAPDEMLRSQGSSIYGR